GRAARRGGRRRARVQCDRRAATDSARRPGLGALLLEEGRVVVDAPEGSRELGPGDVFGERSLLEGVERTARVRAETDVCCIAIPRPELERVIAARPELGERLRHLS